MRRAAEFVSLAGSRALWTQAELAPIKHSVLPVNWFAYVLPWALRQAIRHSEYLTLVTIRASRAYIGLTVDVGPELLSQFAELIGLTIRESDLIGEIEDGRLGLLLLHTDHADASHVIRRLTELLHEFQFPASFEFAIGAASCPADGVDMPSLVAYAVSHSRFNVQGRVPLSLA